MFYVGAHERLTVIYRSVISMHVWKGRAMKLKTTVTPDKLLNILIYGLVDTTSMKTATLEST